MKRIMKFVLAAAVVLSQVLGIAAISLVPAVTVYADEPWPEMPLRSRIRPERTRVSTWLHVAAGTGGDHWEPWRLMDENIATGWWHGRGVGGGGGVTSPEYAYVDIDLGSVQTVGALQIFPRETADRAILSRMRVYITEHAADTWPNSEYTWGYQYPYSVDAVALHTVEGSIALLEQDFRMDGWTEAPVIAQGLREPAAGITEQVVVLTLDPPVTTRYLRLAIHTFDHRVGHEQFGPDRPQITQIRVFRDEIVSEEAAELALLAMQLNGPIIRPHEIGTGHGQFPEGGPAALQAVIDSTLASINAAMTPAQVEAALEALEAANARYGPIYIDRAPVDALFMAGGAILPRVAALGFTELSAYVTEVRAAANAIRMNNESGQADFDEAYEMLSSIQPLLDAIAAFNELAITSQPAATYMRQHAESATTVEEIEELTVQLAALIESGDIPEADAPAAPPAAGAQDTPDAPATPNGAAPTPPNDDGGNTNLIIIIVVAAVVVVGIIVIVVMKKR